MLFHTLLITFYESVSRKDILAIGYIVLAIQSEDNYRVRVITFTLIDADYT